MLVFILSSWVNAVEVKDLYQAKVPVTAQTLAQKSHALKKAMQMVLIKVGGGKDVLSNHIIKKALQNNRLYVSQYSYSLGEIKTLPHLEMVSADNAESLFLLVSFDENKINQLLQQAQLPLWGSLRPQVLFWLVEENKFSRQILSESSHSNVPSIVLNLAEKHGLPVIMPLMDFTDTTQITIPDLWGRFSNPIKAASQRYQADAVVVVRISNSSLLEDLEIKRACQPLCNTLKVDQQLVMDWTIFSANINQFSVQSYQGININLLLKKMLSDITDVIYQGYALSEQANSELIIDVVNIDSMTAYVALTDFLLDLSVVNAVMLLSADGNSRRFRLDLLGSKQTLLSLLKLNNKLEQYSDPFAKDSEDAVPVFLWSKE